MTIAFHTNWSKPFCVRNKKEKYTLNDFEILITILSALKWREHNGSIILYADKISAEVYRELNLEHLYDLGINEDLDNIDKDIDSNIFWAASKIYALSQIKGKVVMLDNDFVLWNTLPPDIKEQDIAVIHKESIDNAIYPDKNFFKLKKQYAFKEEWDFSIDACNTALAYFNNEEFKNYYTSQSIECMKNIELTNDRSRYMVFAEQRLLSMCAYEKNINITEISPLRELTNSIQRNYTHLWGYKKILSDNKEERQKFCIRCINRILKDFPEEEETLNNIEILQKYIQQMKAT